MNYHNLTLSNAGTKTFASGTTGISQHLHHQRQRLGQRHDQQRHH